MCTKNVILMAALLTMTACGGNNTASDDRFEKSDSLSASGMHSLSATDDESVIHDPTSILYVGTYKEVNDDGYDAQLRLWAWEDELNIKLDAFYEERMYVTGKIDPGKAVSVGERGVKLPITLHVMDAGQVIASDDAVLTFTPVDGNLYNLHTDFVNEPSETPVRNLMADYRLFLTDPNVEHIVETVPMDVSAGNITLAGLLPELNKYVFMPELWSTVNYLRRGEDAVNLGENEMIRIDERNRFFSYSWGDFNIELQGKYFDTADGKLMLVLDQHDATYDNDQNLHIYIIDPKHGTLTEEEAYNVIPKEYIDRNAIFQVRRATEGVVAVYDDGTGALDAKTLKFNGKTFD